MTAYRGQTSVARLAPAPRECRHAGTEGVSAPLARGPVTPARDPAPFGLAP